MLWQIKKLTIAAKSKKETWAVLQANKVLLEASPVSNNLIVEVNLEKVPAVTWVEAKAEVLVAIPAIAVDRILTFPKAGRTKIVDQRVDHRAVEAAT